MYKSKHLLPHSVAIFRKMDKDRDDQIKIKFLRTTNIACLLYSHECYSHACCSQNLNCNINMHVIKLQIGQRVKGGNRRK